MFIDQLETVVRDAIKPQNFVVDVHLAEEEKPWIREHSEDGLVERIGSDSIVPREVLATFIKRHITGDGPDIHKLLSRKGDEDFGIDFFGHQLRTHMYHTKSGESRISLMMRRVPEDQNLSGKAE